METRKLAVFVDLATTQNYSRSAERMFLSQSTISKYIMALERDWQVQLFERAHRQVTLTRIGQQLLPRAQAILREERQLQQVLAANTAHNAQSLVVQGLPSLAQYQAFHIITAFTKRYPEVKLQFSEASVDRLAHALDHTNVDIVFTRIFGDQPNNYDVLLNETDQFVVLVPKDDPLAQQAEISLSMLVHESILLLKDTIGEDNPLFSAFQKMHTPQMVYDGQRIDLILEMLNQGDGVSVVMARSFDLTGFDNIKAIPLTPTIRSQMAFMKRPDNHAAVVAKFWAFATKYSQSLSD
ncbi:LysR family transcriptional regulator [Lactiplantibacillus plantarum]|uniref:LysR family transcriptional regulator n=1 Tax=Lactiplantibacillus plantarum TaxID=1590 RepID=UPI000932AC9A|nr:LysR family transcriptional regulator [Lactiplantibacillus plantarum]MBC6382109.1 LysR family transcriptional regulator [Lactiplantibacillus plantarum]MCG0834306.1 transcription regulator [Lactiplantibacillus plantarum]MCT0220275.1 LysR family transcriptional regulator [Lactiplantibacillus plantarum]MCW6117236.1 LysR family transcriptional regulator [Lactiplantibacillus plantarum]QAA28477.1 LysR family transcriptional regulator [Lactiplantibacillus plantarum]